MEKLLIAVVLFATCWAKPEDLTGKVFVFPRETDLAHVKLLTSRDNLESVTVCLKFLTDLSRNYGIFSLSTPSHSNAFLLFNKEDKGTMEVAVAGASIHFQSLSYPENTWHSVCATWDGNTGVAQLWVDGKPSVRRFVNTGSLVGQPITTLGQEQDSYGGSFDKQQSFVGMISDVHMWDHVVPPSHIKRFAGGQNFNPGNVFNWRALEYEKTEQVFVEDETAVM